jgi:hypothetical protein
MMAKSTIRKRIRKRTVNIVVGERHLGKIDTVARDLRKLGVEIPSHGIARTVGSISGVTSVPLEKLRTVQGVELAEEAGSVQLPDPEADVQ